jgi:hypothetical protein
VVVIQLLALGYGFWTVFVARPVHLVFEYNRFRVVHAIDVPRELLPMVPPAIQVLPIFGPTLLSLRPFKNNAEEMDATLAAIQGLPLAARPDLWQSYAAGIPDILKAAKSVDELKTRFPTRAEEVDSSLTSADRTAENTVYLPLVGRKSFWTVLLDSKTAEIIAYVPIDSF